MRNKVEIMQHIEERLNQFQTHISQNHNEIVQLGLLIDQAAKENFKAQIASLKLTQGKLLKSIEQLDQEKAEKDEMND